MIRAWSVRSCARQSDVHEEASVKTGARRWRDFPDIHSASSATAECHERVCGRSHSIPRRRDAPRRTSGCDLSPATDLDLDDLLLAVTVRPGSSPSENLQRYSPHRITKYEQFFGWYRERLAGGAGGGNERPGSPARGRRNPGRMSLPRTPRPRPASGDHLLPRALRPDWDTARRDGPGTRPDPFESAHDNTISN
jgi:hypothetical protein